MTLKVACSGWREMSLGPCTHISVTIEGFVASKRHVVGTIRIAAEHLRLLLHEPSGADGSGGRALRRGGAQFLGASDVDVRQFGSPRLICRPRSTLTSHSPALRTLTPSLPGRTRPEALSGTTLCGSPPTVMMRVAEQEPL